MLLLSHNGNQHNVEFVVPRARRKEVKSLTANSLLIFVRCAPPAGHSHQLFHISAVVGTHFQMEGVITDMMSRRAVFTAQGATASLQGTVGALILGLLLNLGVIGVFSAPLLRKAERCAATAPPLARGERREE